MQDTTTGASFVARWGHITYRKRWWVVGGWVAGLVVAFAFVAVVGGNFVDSFRIPGSESQQAIDLLQENFPAQSGSSGQLVFKADDGIERRRRASPHRGSAGRGCDAS